MMKSSLLLSFFFFSIILQASWCLASETSNGEKLATLPPPQVIVTSRLPDRNGIDNPVINSLPFGLTTARKKIINYVAEAGTIKDVGLPRETFAADVPNAKYSRKLRNVVTLQTMSLSHKGGTGGGGGGGGSGVGGARGGGGSQSDHQAHKKDNNANSLAYNWIFIVLEFGIYAIAALPFTLI